MNIFNQYTKKTLIKNKHRTVVSVIGITLAVVMITIILTSFESIRYQLMSIAQSDDGSWNGVIYNLDSQKLEEIISENDLKSYGTIQNLGYAAIDNVINPTKPYIYVGGLDDNAIGALPIHIIDGRMPENSSEIILPAHLPDVAKGKYSLGQKITLDLNVRTRGEKTAWQKVLVSQTDEILKSVGDESYTVVGFYKKPSFEPVIAPGYTALTIADNQGYDSYDGYFNLSKPTHTQKFLEKYKGDYKTDYNDNYLTFIGASYYQSERIAYIAVLVGVLILVGLFCSLMIYNSFAISVRERTKQFGLLKSIGATKKQIKQCVIYEGFILSVISIPAGLIIGILVTMGVLKYGNSLINLAIKSSSVIDFSIHISLLVIALIVLFSIAVIWFSAIIPAKKAMRISPIDSIRQTKYYSTKRKKTKHKRYNNFEKMLISKNLKRSRKKYISAILSVTLSIILFVGTNSIVSYLLSNIETFMQTDEYDLTYYITDEFTQTEELYHALLDADTITDGNYCFMPSFSYAKISTSDIDDNYDEVQDLFMPDYKNEVTGYDCRVVECDLKFMNDDSFMEYAESLNLDTSKYSDFENPLAIVNDKSIIYVNDKHQAYTFNTTKSSSFSAQIITAKDIEGYYVNGSSFSYTGVGGFDYNKKDNKYEYDVRDVDNLFLSYEQSAYEFTTNVGYVNHNLSGGLTFYYPLSAMPAVLKNDVTLTTTVLQFKADDAVAANNSFVEILSQFGLPEYDLWNNAAENISERSAAALAKLFVNMFVILLSLIAAANIFNTVSTDFILRRREFAMLKSMGCSNKSLSKIVITECLIYSLTGLVIGLPISVSASYIVGKFAGLTIASTFALPWKYILISIAGVFIIMTIAIVYSLNKLKKDNTIDTIKNENI